MVKRRRGSQAFNFEQSQETLLQNETIVNLYKNKVFVPPDPKELETILEEYCQQKVQRAKRGQVSSVDGSLVLGVNKSKRAIEEYKFWKKDDKERIKKRKLMITKQWKGRKKPKTIPLDLVKEQQLINLIADRVSSDEEDDDDDVDGSSPVKRRRTGAGDEEAVKHNQCVWSAVEDDQRSSRPSVSSTGSSDTDYLNTCVWNERLGEEESRKSVEATRDEVLSLRRSSSIADSNCSKKRKSSLNLSSLEASRPSIGNTSRRRKSSLNLSSVEMSGSRQRIDSTGSNNKENSLLELQGLIPDSELAELLETDDLLFCNDKKPRRGGTAVTKVLGNIKNTEAVSSAGVDKQNSKLKSLRRSVRLMGASVTTCGSQPLPAIILTSETEETESPAVDLEDVDDGKDKISPPRTRSRSRRSYSLEDGCKKYSLDGSKKNRL